MAKKYEIDMTDGPMLRKMIVFAIPLMLSGCLQLLFNTVDVIVVGRCVGDTALAAVGSTGALTNLIIGLFMGLSVGTNVLCAQGFGAGRTKDVQDAVHTSVLISLIFGTVPFFSRQVEAALAELDPGLIEAAQSMGDSPW